MHRTRRTRRAARPRVSSARFSPTPFGFLRYRWRSGKRLEKSSWKTWRPRILELERLRVTCFGDIPWSEIAPEDIAYDLMQRVYAGCKSKRGGPPSTNTYRGRYDAAYAYFDFLLLIGALADDHTHPLDFLGRPSSKANPQPWLTPSDDAKIASTELLGHEEGVYALLRGAALREEEAADVLDDDVNLADHVITIRDGKTGAAIRQIFISPATAVRLGRYRAWRNKNVQAKSSRFLRSSTGRMSVGYIWKIVKQIGVRAEVQLTEITLESGDTKTTTEITPHSLRRTYGSDLTARGVRETVITSQIGHARDSITRDSYILASNLQIAKEAVLAAGEGPFSFPAGVTEAEREFARVKEHAALDPVQALEDVRRLKDAAAAMEELLLRLASAEGSAQVDPLSCAA
jgi:integrase